MEGTLCRGFLPPASEPDEQPGPDDVPHGWQFHASSILEQIEHSSVLKLNRKPQPPHARDLVRLLSLGAGCQTKEALEAMQDASIMCRRKLRDLRRGTGPKQMIRTRNKTEQKKKELQVMHGVNTKQAFQ